MFLSCDSSCKDNGEIVLIIIRRSRSSPYNHYKLNTNDITLDVGEDL